MATIPYPSPSAAAGDGSSTSRASGASPALREDRSLGLLLVLVALLQVYSWWQLEGYQLADSVEYMERARALAAGEHQPAEGMVRSFGFSSLLVPFFWLSDRLALPDTRVIIHGVRLFQMALGLALVVVCARIGARLAGRDAGLAAAFIAGLNPIFLQYSVSPVSGVAAALCVALALAALLERDRRHGLLGGLALGAGLLMAYQTVVIALPLIALVALRNRRGGRGQTLALLGGYTLGILAQIGLDRVTYGQWGVTLVNYLLENAGTRIAVLLHHLGFSALARSLYEQASAVESSEPVLQAMSEPLYYLREIQRMLVAPVAAFTALGLVLAVLSRRWSASILALVLIANVLVMSSKGAKSFRLWLPLIPFIAPLAGMGVAWVAGPPGARARVARRAGVALALAAALVLGVATLREVNTRRYGVYWQAMEHVNASAAAARGDSTVRPRVASAYHWAVFLRESPDVELVKLPEHLHRWNTLGPAARAEALEALLGIDWLLLHQPILEQERALFDRIAQCFDVVAGYWTPDTDPDLGPVLVLRRLGLDPAGKPLVRALLDVEVRSWRDEQGLGRHLLEPLTFLEPEQGPQPAAEARRLVYLGWRWQPLAGSGLDWIEHHWWTDTGLAGDWVVVDRITDPTGLHAWQNDHVPGYGFRPTSGLAPGTLLVEGYTLLAGAEPFTPRFEPLGGPWRRGDLIPAWMWLALARFDGEGRVVERMLPARRDGRTPVDLAGAEELPHDVLRSAEGLIFSPDRLVRVGPFFLPVQARFRWPDDGRPDPE